SPSAASRSAVGVEISEPKQLKSDQPRST
ncbi:MAG: hypothetical protein JWM62_786, partial [Frankiales bacterium]|nr:hypothetical protein [Frankiales bacterium]